MNKSSHTRTRPFRRLLSGLLITLSVGLFVTGCGESSGTYEGSPPPDYASKLADSPSPLAALHQQENELPEGGVDAFNEQIMELKGFPVVINIWASWCGPCREEFPYFQDAAADMGREVAFLGINSMDGADSAATFLRDNPVPYPSFFDPDREIGSELDLPRGLPATLFLDEDGEKTYLRQGGYSSLEELKADIQTYAVEGGQG